MMKKTIERLTEKDLANIHSGQYVYCVFDKNKKEIKYYIPREKDILMTYNGTAVKEMCGNRQIQPCDTCDEAEFYAWSVVKNFQLFSKK